MTIPFGEWFILLGRDIRLVGVADLSGKLKLSKLPLRTIAGNSKGLVSLIFSNIWI